MNATDKRVVLITVPDSGEASAIAKKLVEEKLAACVNIAPGIRSVYMWKGEICDEAEVLLIAKTVTEKAEALIDTVLRLHSYEVPEIICLPVTEGAKDYLGWIEQRLKP